jgi:hypothetical protein
LAKNDRQVLQSVANLLDDSSADPNVQLGALKALQAMGPLGSPAAARVGRMIKSSNAELQVQAVETLGEMKAGSYASQLVDLIGYKRISILRTRSSPRYLRLERFQTKFRRKLRRLMNKQPNRESTLSRRRRHSHHQRLLMTFPVPRSSGINRLPL